MKKIQASLIIMIVFYSLFLISCAGEDSVLVDTTPPQKAEMVPHLGDFDGNSQTDYWGNNALITDENNGIDAVSGGDWIRIMWKDLNEDTDLEFYRVYRYREEFSGIVDSTFVDSVIISNDNFYIDKFNKHSGTALYNDWFYYIEVFDRAGNSTFSDTVCYRLEEKPNLSGFSDVNPDSLIFQWGTISGISKYLFLIFDKNDQNGELSIVKSESITDTDPQFPWVEYSFPKSELSNGKYYWRVDAFGDDNDKKSGSESIISAFEF